MDRVYKLLQGLQPEFEAICSQLFNRENPLSFDDTVSQLLIKESRLQEIKGRIDSTSYVHPNSKTSTPNQDTSKENAKKGTVNLRKTYGVIIANDEGT